MRRERVASQYRLEHEPGPPSLTQFGLPDLPDSLELALDAAAGQAQPVGDLFIPMAFELALGNGAQAIVVERAHQTLILFHRDRQHFRRRGIAQDFVEPRAPAIAALCLEHGITADPPAATLSLLEQALLVDHFADGDGGQQLPELLTIDHGGELAFGGALVQTTQNAQDRKSTRLNSSHLVISYAV